MQLELWQLLDDYEDHELADVTDWLKKEATSAAKRGDRSMASEYYAAAVSCMVCVASRQRFDQP